MVLDGGLAADAGNLVAAPETRAQPKLNGSTFPTSAMREAVGPAPEHADPTTGLVPLGALAERVPPADDWAQSARDRVLGDRLSTLVDRAATAQWSATADVHGRAR